MLILKLSLMCGADDAAVYKEEILTFSLAAEITIFSNVVIVLWHNIVQTKYEYCPVLVSYMSMLWCSKMGLANALRWVWHVL